MSGWTFTDFASKENLLRAIRQHSNEMLALASAPGAWESPTASGHWQVRDIIEECQTPRRPPHHHTTHGCQRTAAGLEGARRARSALSQMIQLL
jgi:hypothetical protein